MCKMKRYASQQVAINATLISEEERESLTKQDLRRDSKHSEKNNSVKEATHATPLIPSIGKSSSKSKGKRVSFMGVRD